MDLFIELQQKQEDLDKAIKELRKAGQEYAEADATYRRLVAQEALRLKTMGMAVGLIDKVIYDNEDVVKALFQRDLKDVLVTASKESINALKVRIAIIREQLAREYGR